MASEEDAGTLVGRRGGTVTGTMSLYQDHHKPNDLLTLNLTL